MMATASIQVIKRVHMGQICRLKAAVTFLCDSSADTNFVFEFTF
jgi:hypothetical protein